MPYGDLRPIPDPTVLTTEAVERGVAGLREYMESQLAVRDQRMTGIERATVAALVAAEKLSAQQQTCSQQAIAKSEVATKETIDKNAAANGAARDALASRVDDLKERLGTFDARLVAVEARRQITAETHVDARASASFVAMVVGLVFSTVLGIGGLVLAVAALHH